MARISEQTTVTSYWTSQLLFMFLWGPFVISALISTVSWRWKPTSRYWSAPATTSSFENAAWERVTHGVYGNLRCRSTAGFSIYLIVARLLQLTVVSSVNHSASAACDECSDSSCHELVIAWPRETSVEAAT